MFFKNIQREDNVLSLRGGGVGEGATTPSIHLTSSFFSSFSLSSTSAPLFSGFMGRWHREHLNCDLERAERSRFSLFCPRGYFTEGGRHVAADMKYRSVTECRVWMRNTVKTIIFVVSQQTDQHQMINQDSLV